MSLKTFFPDSYSFPPRRSPLGVLLVFPCLVLPAFLAISYIYCQFGFNILATFVCRVLKLDFQVFCEPNLLGTYTAFATLIILLIANRFIEYRYLVHDARLEDPSVVDAILTDADTIETYEVKTGLKPDNYKVKLDNLEKEVKRVRVLGPRGWLEYQLLSTNQLIVDFLPVDDLTARAQSSLEDLQDITSSSGKYDEEFYYRSEERIKEAIKKILEAKEDELKREQQAMTLRAEYKVLLESVASYTKNWAEGSTILHSLKVVCWLTIPLLLGMGLLPDIHPGADQLLNCFNWGFLGIIGSFTAVLLDLRKSNTVEVGNTEGKQQFWRAGIGAILGLLAGILTYWMFSSNLLDKFFKMPDPKDVGAAFVWAVSAGFTYEKVFDRLQNITEGN